MIPESLQKIIDSPNPKTTVSQINDWWNDENNIAYVEDLVLYGEKDYWALPEETIQRKAGDCEDIAIGKWWCLKQSFGDRERFKARLLYSIDHKLGTPHVVVAWIRDFTNPWKVDSDEIYILDNGAKEIYRLANRKDLTPVFYFDEGGVYMPDGKRISDVSKLPFWKELLGKLVSEQ